MMNHNKSFPSSDSIADLKNESEAGSPKAEEKTAAQARFNPDDVLAGHPEDLDSFWRAQPQYLWGPAVVAAAVYGLTRVPTVAAYLSANAMAPYGFFAALHYTVFAILLSYATHAFVVVHVAGSDRLKLQDHLAYNVSPKAMATRSTAALCGQLVYAVFPIAPASSNWLVFTAWVAGFAVFWDAWFYAAHRLAHENKTMYRVFHKTHHLNKHPNCFGAYFVEYQSHLLLEVAVVFFGVFAGLPRDVFDFYMYYGTLGTYLEHCGFELGTLKLPLVPVTFGRATSFLSFYAFYLLEGVNTAEHDWHHEKFTANYSLSFKYLDKLFGTYNTGREPGPNNKKAEEKSE